MHEIVTAIIDRDMSATRTLLRKDSELKDFKSVAGFSIYDLAEKTGDYLILACIYRETQSKIKSREALLYGILATLSQDYFCAQYASGIEYYVWHCLENNGDWPPELEDIYHPIESETLADIIYVVDQTESWYDDDIGLVSTQDWLQKYR